jgi:Vault protein inter-alpha-trypsin domain
MSALAQRHPINALCDGVLGLVDEERAPIPLTAMRVAIEIRRGLAIITTTRSFRNAEAVPIEAVLTFPVPFDSVMTGLRAVIDGRTLTARAKPRTEARQTYEDALDGGKTAILHEEALRGVHVLAVGHLGPGKSVDIVAELAMPLTFIGGVPVLRIPMTVGHLYGASPLIPSDDLGTSERGLQRAELSIRADSGSPRLLAGPLIGEMAMTIPLDRAIEISVPGAQFGTRDGYDAKGRSVRLSLTPAATGEGNIEASVLFDRSGSTGELMSGDEFFPECGPDNATVWDTMRLGLSEALAELRPSDRVSLWQFNGACQPLGAASGADAAALTLKVEGADGGTELGAAVETAVAAGSRDILVLTDGQTWASEVHSAASRGCRVSAVLVGSASLDAMIGHLAAITGGQIFAAQSGAVGPAVSAAIASMRSPAAPFAGSVSANGEPMNISMVRGGIRVEVAWGAAPTDHSADAVGRYAASLALPLLDESRATNLAAEHGLCSHLTSLVLVDEAGDAVEGLPEMRKVPLARVLQDKSVGLALSMYNGDEYFLRAAESIGEFNELAQPERKLDVSRTRRAQSFAEDLPPSSGIDWDRLANALLAGDLSGLTDEQRELVNRLAGSNLIVDLATAMASDPIQTAIALIAETAESRMAQRLARRALRNAPAYLLARAQAQAKQVMNGRW